MIYRVASALLILGIIPAIADQAVVDPPAHAPLLVYAQADGVQIYACETTEKGPEWVFKAPEANLFDAEGRQIGSHFAGPSWKLTDGSEVVGPRRGDDNTPGRHEGGRRADNWLR
jgi:hypothetical protein